jgi:hypothetical protein
MLPTLLDAVVFTDCAVMVVRYCELSSLQTLLSVYDRKHQPIDNRVVLYYSRCMLKMMIMLIESNNWISNAFTLDNLLLTSTPDALDTVYHADGRGGWSERRLLFAGLPHALPADSLYIVPDADNPVGRDLDMRQVRRCILALLHADDPSVLSPQWQQLFEVLDAHHSDPAMLRQCVDQIDGVLSAASNPTLKALLVRQEMMLMQ